MILDRERELVPSSACGGGRGRGHNEEVNYQVCMQAPKPPSQPVRPSGTDFGRSAPREPMARKRAASPPAPQRKGRQSHAS